MPLSEGTSPNKALQPTPHRSVQSIHGTIWRQALLPESQRLALSGAAERPDVRLLVQTPTPKLDFMIAHGRWTLAAYFGVIFSLPYLGVQLIAPLLRSEAEIYPYWRQQLDALLFVVLPLFFIGAFWGQYLYPFFAAQRNTGTRCEINLFNIAAVCFPLVTVLMFIFVLIARSTAVSEDAMFVAPVFSYYALVLTAQSGRFQWFLLKGNNSPAA